MPTLKEVQSFCEWITRAGCVHCISINDYVYFGVITEAEKPKNDEEKEAFWQERRFKNETDWIIRKRVADLGIHPQEMAAVSNCFYIMKSRITDRETFGWIDDRCLEGIIFAEAVTRILFQRKFFEQIATIKGVYEYQY
jgi:hypothetical protein